MTPSLAACFFLVCVAPQGSHASTLLPKPAITPDDAVGIAKEFVDDPTARLGTPELVVVGMPRRVFYGFSGITGGTHDVAVNASTGRLGSVTWMARMFTARRAAPAGRKITDSEAVAAARTFLASRHIDLAGLADRVSSTYSQREGAVTVYFAKLSDSGVCLNEAAVEVSAANGDIVMYRADSCEPTVSTTPGVTREQVEQTCRALLRQELSKVRIDLQLDQDTLGDQRLSYLCHLHGPVEVTGPDGAKTTRDILTVMSVDAGSGEVLTFGGDWRLRGLTPPLTRPVPTSPRVVFRGEQIWLFKPPVVRGANVLLSKLLFEGLGAKIAFDEASGELVLEKAEDPIVCKVGSLDATQDGDPFQLPVPPEVVNGHPYLPVVLVTRLLGMPVRWDAEKDRLYIDCEGRPEPE